MSDQANTEQKVFDLNAAAVYLQSIGVTSATVKVVRRLIADGAIGHLKIGRRFYVKRVALDSWIDSRGEKRQRR